MEQLLKILLSIFAGDLGNLENLIQRLISKWLEGVDDVKGCAKKLAEWASKGELDDKFESDPLCVILCIANVVIHYAERLTDHEHENDDDERGPIILGSSGPEEQDAIFELAGALGVQQPAGSTEAAGGRFTDILLNMVIDKLLEILKEKMEEWAK